MFALIAGQPVIVVLVLMVGGTVLIGLIMERVGYRPIRGAPEVAALLTSFAIGQILQNGTLLTTRLMNMRSPYPFPSIDFLSGVFTVGPITDSQVECVQPGRGHHLVGPALVVCHPHESWACRCAPRRKILQAAQLMGININRVIATAFAIGAGLAAVAGLFFAVQAGQINPYMGFSPVLKAFIACVIGGFGSIQGAVVGGYVLGALEVLLTAVPGLGDILPATTAYQAVFAAVAAQHVDELSRCVRVRCLDPDAAGAPEWPAGQARA